MVCPRCATNNEDSNRYCGRCGLEFAKVQPAPTESDPDAVPCYRHPGEKTLLRCGRCDKPVCSKCVVMGPAGTRCRECSRHNVNVGKAVAADAQLGVRRLFRMGPSNLWMWFLVASILSMIMRGCYMMGSQPPPDVPSEQEETRPSSSV